jgi:uncharacterized RDD family membrane protein YckC
VETGPLGKRLIACLVDALVPALIGLIAWVLIRRSDDLTAAAAIYVVTWILVVAWLVLVWAMFATRAAGPGMRLMRLQLVGLRNGRPIGWGRYLFRAIVLGVLSATVVGLIVLLVFLVRHPRKQGWHDLVADSVVIKQRPLAPGRRSVEAAQRAASPAASAPARAAAPVGEEGRPGMASATAGPGAAQSRAGEQGPAARPPAPGRTAAPVPTRTLQPPVTEDSVRSTPRRSAQPTASSAGSHALPPLPSVPDDGRPLDQGWFAVLDDGREIEVSGLLLLGRNPQPRPGEEDAELIKVADETRTVSKTHLSLSVDANGLFVMDRGSTNGTTVTSTRGESRPCPAGDVVSVSEGIVSFGDHWLRVERRGGRS